MPPIAPSRNDWEADSMAKLQKSLKQRQRHSIQARPHVARLTPAEIRQLNNSAAASNNTSISPSSRTSEQSSRGLSNTKSNATPPPESPTAYHAQVSRASSIDLPTPPRTPTQQRRASQSSVNNPHHHGHMHHPRPRASKQADFMIANGLQSRRSSGSTSSSANRLPMYRGHEVTRTGSVNVLQRPAQDIVANPLSMFSRPRQPTVNSAPDPRRDFPDMDPYQAQVFLEADANDAESVEQEKEISPVQRTDSPVSMEETKFEGATKMPLGEMRGSNRSDDVKEAVSNADAGPSVEAEELSIQRESKPVQHAAVSQSDTGAIPKKASKKRFTFHSGFMDKKGKDQDSAVLSKKDRRRTVSFTKSTNTKAPPEDPSSKPRQASQEPLDDDVIPAHPAVRPLSPTSGRNRSTSNPASIDSVSSAIGQTETNTHPPSIDKGKATLSPLVVPKGPVYGRCACCGRIKRPHGFSAELSPVLENENIKTNFSIEIDRPRTNHSGSSNEAANQKRYTPIIPMEIPDEAREGSIRTVQASIEPMAEEHEFEPRKKRDSDPPKFVRFASLHKLQVEEGKDEAGLEEVEVTSTPVVDLTMEPLSSTIVRPHAGFGSNESIDTISTGSVATARPISMMTLQTPPDARVAKRPMSYSAVKAPSERSDNTHSSGPRSSTINHWYENAIKEGPKQDIITVVGWNDRSKKTGAESEGNGHVVEPAKATLVKETSPYETQKAMNNHAASPIKDKEHKRKSLLSSGLFKKLVTSSKPEDANTSTDSTPASTSESPVLRNYDSAISMSGANGFVTTPNSQNSTRPSSMSAHHQTTTTPPPKLDTDSPRIEEQSKSKQYLPAEGKKGHAYKLSLGLGGDDMSLGLPSPYLGPHFARSNLTLKDLVFAQRTPDSEKEFDVAMGRDQHGLAEVRG